LKFRIPNNGCFDDRSVHEFQIRLLRKELHKAPDEKISSLRKLDENRDKFKQKLPNYYIPSIILHCRYDLRLLREKQSLNLNEKLRKLSNEQDSPLFNVHNTVICYDRDTDPPKFVMDTLALGPKNAVLEKFNQNNVLSELDNLLKFCKDKRVSEDLKTDIDIKMLAYVKNCKTQSSSRNIQLTKKYLKDHDLLAIPFDKGIGIILCLMKETCITTNLMI